MQVCRSSATTRWSSARTMVDVHVAHWLEGGVVSVVGPSVAALA